ncbi:aminophospholipid translocase and ATPase [Scheffersomyces amazonensis]|uniref:aminophospholipid translocase and ATPase n=1 Tax=Scheffersomyces amazonensis TaxID=1078765 RepID=UPI00315D12FE
MTSPTTAISDESSYKRDESSPIRVNENDHQSSSSNTNTNQGQNENENENENNDHNINNNHNINNIDQDKIPANVRYTAKDLINTSPPNFKSRIQRFLYNRGLGNRPEYLQEIYNNTPRYIYVNYDLPPDMSDSNGHPIIYYPRNKIRTTKYTPLSFIPKNLLFQFTNIANFYFLVIAILGAFQIFGVPSPGLAAVPLIVIVCITAIKDAFEDNRRGNSDSELNNSPIHLLTGLHNVNVVSDYVGPWRRFKKFCSRCMAKIFKGIKKGFIMIFGSKKRKQELIRANIKEEQNELHRVSTIISEFSMNSNVSSLPPDNIVNEGRPSVSSRRFGRKSHHSNRSGIHAHRPTIANENSLLNPILQAQNENSSKIDTCFKNRRWKDISVGDMIRVRANEEVPADVIILSTSDVEGNCYIETKNLDGETNLKNKSSIHCGGNQNLKHAQDLGNTKFWVECDPPNNNLYAFKGTIHYENYDSNKNLINSDEKEPLNNDNVLLRGCTLRNTKWIIGLVIYTGSETKIMLNSGITPTKLSKISRELNLSVIINFFLVFLLCFISGLINGLFYNHKHVSRLYFDFHPYASTAAVNGIVSFVVALIIYQALIPISLYISVEIIKTLQAFFIFSDIKMYYEKLDYPCVPKTWNISDDLGQIEYIFSDKTGTLTQNVMEFKKCTINGKSYGLAYTEAKQGLDKRAGLDVITENDKWKRIIQDDKNNMIENLMKFSVNDQLRDENVTFVSSDYVKDTMLTNNPLNPQKLANEQFMLALALCHTVVTEENEYDPELRDFKAESPDESALVSVARDLGIVFKERLRKRVIVKVYGDSQEYELLDIIPFTSARKRMSCIIKTPQGKILMITKGADNVIFQRLDGSLNSSEVISKTALHLEDFAKEGLRTLCIAQKDLDANFYYDWSARFKEAYASIDDSREAIIEQLEEEIEQGLILLGGTAIEDRLQAGVPDSIAILAQAGIKLWVLTGDRIETAINIGFSCNLLENEMKLLVVRPETEDIDQLDKSIEYIDQLITNYLQEYFGLLKDKHDSNEIDRLIEEAKKDHSAPSPHFALIIDGAALSVVFQDLTNHSSPTIQKLRQKFLLLGKQCRAVICCRVSPAQKADVVKTVKSNLGVMTLAIGDGANDVAMIQAANVGVGIAGEEGRQAVMSSDYAIGQFRFLTRLLLVHGRWSYKRLAEMVPCFFYKNVVFTLTCFWFGIFTNFDGSYLYEYTFLMFYNLAFTSLPVIVLAVMDQDVSDTVSLLVPQLYRTGILGIEWSQYKFVWYMFDGLYQSVISFFFPYLLFYIGFQNPQGMTIDHRFWMGVVCAALSVTACNIYVLLQQNRWDRLSLTIDIISILIVYFWTGVWSANLYSQEFYRAGAQVLGTLACWCCIFIGVVACVLPRFVFDFLKRNFIPRDIDIIREQVRNGKYDDYPQGYDPTDLEDVERHRLVTELIDRDPSLLEKLEKERETTISGYSDENQHHHHNHHNHEENNALSKTFNSIKRAATLRKNTLSSGGGRSRSQTITEQFRRPIDLNQLRLQMIQQGEYKTSRNSLERVDTTHEVPGLTQAESLIRLHTRNSINLN